MTKRLLLMLFAAFLVVAGGQSGKRYVAVVSNFGVGMNTNVAPYASPQTIAWYKNFISTQPNGTHLRYGYVGLLPDPAGAPTDTTTAIAIFAPTKDSTYIVYTAGGAWYGNQAGQVVFRGPTRPGGASDIDWLTTFGAANRINPLTVGDSVVVTSASKAVEGFGTRFIRDVMVGDSILIDTMLRVVTQVYSDARLYVGVAYGATDTLSSHALTRRYKTASGPPYLYQNGLHLYSGNVATPMQVISNIDETLYLREMGVVDSFLIDSIYYFSGRISTQDTAAGDTTGEVRDPRLLYECGPGSKDVRCSTMTSLDQFRTWDTTKFQASPDSFNVYLRSFQIVSRRKSWLTNEWRQSSLDAPEAFYVRLGPLTADTDIAGHGKYYGIAYNDDSSIFLSEWRTTDTSLGYTLGSADSLTTHWRDSLFLGRGLDLKDTLLSSEIVGTWAYIYTTAGAPEPITQDSATQTLHILGRGAVCYTVDTAGAIPDSADITDGMYFLRLTAGDVQYPAYKDLLTRITDIEVVPWGGDETRPELADEDSLLSTRSVWAVFGNCDGGRGDEKLLSSWFSTKQEAYDFMENLDCVWNANMEIERGEEWTIRRGKNTFREVEDDYLNEFTTFPINYIQRNDDTTFFITTISSLLSDSTTTTTENWEIVRARLPRFRQVQGQHQGKGLIGWGDTLAPTTVSFSPGYQPWRFSPLNDLSVGNPSVPITAVASYDNTILAFKHNKIYGLTGGGGVLSDGLGAVGNRAVVVQDKWVFFAAEDGIYKMDRRDNVGYTIRPISRPIDPILQQWNAQEYGNKTVPIAAARKHLNTIQMVYNSRDHHLWVWLSTQSAGGLDVALTYDVEKDIWDGYHTIPAGVVEFANLRDTSRILIGSVDSAYVFGFSYVFADNGAPIDGEIQSKPFVLRDEKGRKVSAKLSRIGVSTRSFFGAYDSAWVLVSGAIRNDSTTVDTFKVAAAAHRTGWNHTEYYYPTSSHVALEWDWKFEVYGSTGATMFMPIEIEFEWMGVED